MIIGIGTDVLKVGRIHQLIQRQSALRLAKRIMTPNELNRFLKDGQVQQLANTWAIKEATYKAMYPTMILGWKDIELIYTDKKPQLILQDYKTHASLSHDGDYTVAFVLIEK